MIGGLGIWEILVIFLIVLLLFGARRLPEIGSSLGKGIREFKDSIRDRNDGERREIPGREPESEDPRSPPRSG